MEKKLKFETHELKVMDVYPYQNGNGTQLLRIKVSENDHTYSDIDVLRGYDGVIEYYEDNEKKNDYEGYERDYRSTYYHGVWQIELTRESEEQRSIEMLEDAVIELAQLISDAQEKETTDVIGMTE